MNSSIFYSSTYKKTNETQKQSSKSIDYQSVNSSCITSKKLKSINKFRSTIHTFCKNMKKNKNLLLNLFHLNNLNANFYENNNKNHNFIKTKSCDSILPNILEINTFTPKANKTNLKMLFKSDNNHLNYKNKNSFYTLNHSNYSTTFNSLITQKSNISNNIQSLKSEYSCTHLSNNKLRNKNFISLSNIINIDDNYNIHKEKLKRENVHDYLKKTKKIIISKYAQNDMKKLIYEEKEKIQNDIEKQNLDLNLLNKLYILFKKFIISYDNYFFYLIENIQRIKKENNDLIEKKKKLNIEIFSLGNIVFRIQNKLKDYLNNKYFLLSVKNHTRDFNYFTSKDKREFNFDLTYLDKIEKKLNSLFTISNNEEKQIEERKRKYNEELKKISSSSDKEKEKLKRLYQIRKKFSSQKSVGDSMTIKTIFRSPNQFIKDLKLISIGINNALKKFNKIQMEVLDDKQLLSKLNQQSFDNENIEKEYQERIYTLNNRLKNVSIYNNYLEKNRNNLVFKYKKKYNNKDTLLIKIKNILNNIKKSDDEKLLQ